MQTSKTVLTAKLAVLTAAMALCGAAYAAAGTANATSQADGAQAATATASQAEQHTHKKDRHHRWGGKHHQHRAAMWVPGYGPLNKEVVESLALTEQQIKLVDAAKAEQKAQHSERRDAMKSARGAKMAQLKSGKLDPQQALKQREETHQKFQAERRQIDEKWLAVWDALDSTQQQKVATHLNERAQEFAKRAELRKQHKQQAQPETTAS